MFLKKLFYYITSFFYVRKAVFDIRAKDMETMDIDSFRVRAQFTGMFDLSKAEEYVIKEAEKKGLIVLNINFQCFE